VAEKMSLAEQFLSELESEALPAAQRAGQSRSDPRSARKHIKALSAATDAYTRKINALKLPCPQTRDAHAYPGYVQWSRDFETRTNRVFASINRASQGQ
jgi:hypothetical protein